MSQFEAPIYETGIPLAQRARLQREVAGFPVIHELVKLALSSTPISDFNRALIWEKRNPLFTDRSLILPVKGAVIRIDLTLRMEGLQKNAKPWIANASFYLHQAFTKPLAAEFCTAPYLQGNKKREWSHATQVGESRIGASNQKEIGDPINLKEFLRPKSTSTQRKAA